MNPRIILASLLVIGLTGLPPASAEVEVPVVPDPCEDVNCPDIVCDDSCNPCEDVDCSPCDPRDECPDPCPEPDEFCGFQDELELVVGLAVQAVENLEDFLEEPYVDDDGDGIPDDTEDSLCRNSTFRREIDNTDYARCEDRPWWHSSQYDLVFDPPTVTELRDEALALVPTQDEVEELVEGNVPDADGDGLPDLLEQVLCGPAVVRNNLDDGPVHCATAADLYVEPAGTFVDVVLGVVDDLQGLVDGDRDGVADDAEPLVCQVENPNFSQDGSCDETLTDYTPPA